jgi:hypothetical protein
LRRIATQVFDEIWSVKRRVSSPEVHMPNRTAKLLSALFASLVLGAPLITAAYAAPAEAEKCLAGPKGTAPQGGHWYYRVDRATKRHCWYIGDEKEKVARAAPVNARASDSAALPPKNAASSQKAIADARAELPLPQMQVEADTSQQPNPAANAPGTETSSRDNAWNSNAQSSVIASRWPESLSVSPSASPAPTYKLAAAAQADAAAPAPAIAAVPPAAADTSTPKQSGSIQTLLIVIIGALALAGLMGSAIFRFGTMRRAGRHGGRRGIWEAAYPGAVAPMPDAGFPREKRAADDPNRRIAEMLARLSRMTAT